MNATPPFPPDPDSRRTIPGPCSETASGYEARADAPSLHDCAAAGRADAVELRTLRERLVVARARAQALEQKARVQADDLEKYRQALAGATEALRKHQNLAASYPLRLGELLAERGRWLAAEYRRRGPAGRLKLLGRIGEFLDLQATLVVAAHPPADWPAITAELAVARESGSPRRMLGGLRRALGRLVRPFRRAA